MSNEELVKLHEHKNEWFVRMARRVLTDRRKQGLDMSATIANLRQLVLDHCDERSALKYLWSLYCLGSADANVMEAARYSIDEHVRSWALRLMADQLPIDQVDGRRPPETTSEQTERVVADLCHALSAQDESPFVRMVVASTIQRLAPNKRNQAIHYLCVPGDESDHRLALMTWYGAEPAVRIGSLAPITSTSSLFSRLAARRIASEADNNADLLNTLLLVTPDEKLSDKAVILAGLLEGFTGWRKAPKPESWDAFAAKVNASGDESLIAKVRELGVLFGDGRALDDVKKLALDGKAELEARKSALRSLIEAKPDDLRAICEKLLTVRFLNTVAVRGLAQFDDPAIGEKLAQSYKTFHPSERSAVIETLVSRPIFARALLRGMANGEVPRDDISAFHARQIRSFADAELTKELGEVWGEIRDSAQDKRELIAKLKAQLTPDILAKADLSKGRVTFEQVCGTCHMLYGHGGQVGPDLTGSGRANLDYLLENVVDPGAVVTADFRLNVLTMKDGRVLNGMVTAKNDRTLTLRTMTEQNTLERSAIAKQDEVPQSLMPEGLLQALSESQVRDLIAYLMAPSQVPLP